MPLCEKYKIVLGLCREIEESILEGVLTKDVKEVIKRSSLKGVMRLRGDGGN